MTATKDVLLAEFEQYLAEHKDEPPDERAQLLGRRELKTAQESGYRTEGPETYEVVQNLGEPDGELYKISFDPSLLPLAIVELHWARSIIVAALEASYPTPQFVEPRKQTFLQLRMQMGFLPEDIKGSIVAIERYTEITLGTTLYDLPQEIHDCLVRLDFIRVHHENQARKALE